MPNYINNLKAPRSKRAGKLSILSKEFLSFLLQRHPEFPVQDYKEFKQICSDGLQAIANIIATTRDGIELPKQSGFILVASCEKTKAKPARFKLSTEHGKGIPQTNMDTDGRLAKILYTNYPIKYKVKYRELWQFEPCRYLKRTVSKSFVEDPEKYIKLSKTEKLSWRFNKKHIINNKNYY